MIVIVFGLPGSGKSYFASKLASCMEAEHINSDRVRKQLFIHRTYSPTEKLAVYNDMLVHMKEAIAQKKSLVIDATFFKDEIRKKFIREAGETIFFIEVRADESVIRERLEQRRPDSEADFTVYKMIEGQFEPMEEPHLTLSSTSSNLKEMIAQALNYLKLADDKRRN